MTKSQCWYIHKKWGYTFEAVNTKNEGNPGRYYISQVRRPDGSVLSVDNPLRFAYRKKDAHDSAKDLITDLIIREAVV